MDQWVNAQMLQYVWWPEACNQKVSGLIPGPAGFLKKSKFDV